MSTKLTAGRIALATVALATLVACGDDWEAPIAADAPGSTATQATLNALVFVSLVDNDINEGDPASVIGTQVCADAAANVDVNIDWADPDNALDTLATITPIASPPGSACAPLGGFTVCDPLVENDDLLDGNNDGICNGGEDCMTCVFDKPVIYGDNLAADASRTVNATFTQGVSVVNQGLTITVHNLAPTIPSVVRDATPLAEGNNFGFVSTVNDRGARADEVRFVEYRFTPVANIIADDNRGDADETIFCDCTNPVAHCPAVGLNSGHCLITGTGNTVDSAFARLLDDDNNPYNIEVFVQDKDGATVTNNTLNTSVGNLPPQNVLIAPVSIDSANPTTIAEGGSLSIPLTFLEQGSDVLAIDFDLDTAMPGAPNFASPDVTGTANITKASWPGLAGSSVSTVGTNVDGIPLGTALGDTAAVTGGILTLASRFNDNNDTNPVDYDIRVAARVTDDDLGSNTQSHFVRVQDVDPIVTSFNVTAGSATPNEGTSTTFTVAAISGDSGTGFDPLHATDRFDWFAQPLVPPAGLPVISADSNFSGSLTLGDEDYYEVTNPAATPALVNFNVQGCTGDPMISVRDTSGNVLTLNDDSLLFGLCSNLDFTIPAGGTVYVGVMGFVDNRTSNYTLQARYPTPSLPAVGAEVEPNDDGSTAASQPDFGGGDFDVLGPVDALVDGLAQPQYTITAGSCDLLTTTCTLNWLDNDPRGRMNIFVEINDEDSFTTSANIPVVVQNVPVVITSTSVNGIPGLTTTVNENSANNVVVGVNIADPALALDGTYTLLVQYGNIGGATSSVTLAVAPGSFPTTAFAYLDNDVCPAGGANGPGLCTVTVTACEAGGTICATTNGTITVNNVVPTATAAVPATGTLLVEGVPFNMDGSFTDPALGLDGDGAANGLYTFNWNYSDNGTPENFPGSTTFALNELNSGPGSFDNVPAPVGANPGLQTVSISVVVTDEDAGASTASTNIVNVRDNVPQLEVTSVNLTNPLGEPTAASLTVNLRAETDSDRVSHVRVDWGDGEVTTYCDSTDGPIQGGAVCDVPVDTGITGVGAAGTVGLILTKRDLYADSDGVPVSAASRQDFQARVTIFDEDSFRIADADNDGDFADAEDIDGTEVLVANQNPTFVAYNPDPTASTVPVSEGTAAAFIITTTDPSNTTNLNFGLLSVVDLPSLRLTVDWGDGSALETFLNPQVLGLESIFRAAHVYTLPGLRTVTFTVTDKEGGFTTETGQVDVVNIPPVITDVFNTGPVDEAQDITTVALVDNRGADLLDITFVDDCIPAQFNNDAIYGPVAAPPLNSPTAVHDSNFTDDENAPINGEYPICVRVCDEDLQPNSCVYAVETALVDNVNPTVLTFPPVTLIEGGTVTLAATGSDPAGAGDPLSFLFDCTDDGPTVGEVADTTSPFQQSCTYARSGSFTARVTVSDDDTGSSTRTTAITVTNAAPVLGVLSAPNVNEGTPTVFTAAGSDAGLDALVFEFDFNADGTFDASSASGVASFTYGTDGAKTWRARVCDSDGACSATSANQTTTVNNVAPVINAINAPTASEEGQSVTVSTSASDAGNDVLGYSFTFVSGATTVRVPAAGTQASSAASAVLPENGTWTLTVAVTDTVSAGAPATTSQNATITVSNVAPAITAFTATPAIITENGTSALAASATDVAADPLSASFDCTDDGVADTVDATAPFTATCAFPNSGTFTARVTFTDGDGGVSDRATTIRVNNGPPVLSAAPTATTVTEGSPTVFSAAGSDPGGDPLTFQFDVDNNGTFDLIGSSGTASFTYTTDGSKTFAARVCDSEGLCSASQTGTATVNNVAPVIGALNVPGTANEGGSVAVSASATDAGADVLSYTFTFTRTPAFGAAIVVGPQTSSAASATLPEDGNWSVAVAVTDVVSTGAPATTTQNAAIVVANLAPVLGAFAAPTPISEGGIANLSITATDVAADALTAAFDCTDDGVADTVDATAPFTASCTYLNNGTFTARVTVTDDEGASADRITTVVVNNAAPTFTTFTATTVNEGQTTVFNVSGALDAGGDALTAQIDLTNDGIFDLTAAVAAGSASASFAYATSGTRTAAARVCDNAGSCAATLTVLVTVNNVAPVINSVNTPVSALAGSPITVSVNASDAGNDPLTYTFTFRQGAVVQQVIGPQSSSTATTTFGTSGSYTLDIAVNDGVATTTLTSAAVIAVTEIGVEVVATANPNPIDEGGSSTVTAIPSGTGPYLASFDINGDGDFTDPEDVEDFACDGDAISPCQVIGNFAQNEPNDVGIRIRVVIVDTGNGNSTSAAIVSLEVRNVAPVLDALTGDTIEEQSLFTATATASDVGTLDTLTFELVDAPEGMTIDASTGDIDWTPDFDQAGANDVTVRVTDSDGAASNEETFTVTVTIIDTNGNSVSDTFERLINGGNLFPPGSDTADTDSDGITDLQELLDGTDPNSYDGPRAPTVIAPAGAVVNTVTPTLTVANAFTPRGEELTYTFCVFEAAGGLLVGCETNVPSGQSTTSVVFDAFPLDEQGSYEWSAFADDQFTAASVAAVPPESVRGSFTVDAQNLAPPVPELLTPADDASFLAGTLPTLEARAVVDPDGDSVSYVFEFSDDDTFPVGSTTASEPRDVPFFTFGAVPAVGEYFWRVQATDGVLSSAFSAAFAFTIAENEVNLPPTEPGIVSPTGAVLTTSTATLTITASTDANDDAITYEFELATDASFAGATSFAAQAGLTLDVTTLTDDTRYFWRARATDGQLASDWVVASFSVNSENDAPLGLVLISPPDGSILSRDPTEFSVQSARDGDNDALTYEFVLSSKDDFTGSPIAQDTKAGTEGVTSFGVADLGLTKGKEYFWRVTASDGNGGEVIASASFTMFKAAAAADPGPTVAAGGGGLCSGTGSSPSGIALIALFGAALAVRRRRRG